jgi:hypothetical protein
MKRDINEYYYEYKYSEPYLTYLNIGYPNSIIEPQIVYAASYYGYSKVALFINGDEKSRTSLNLKHD